MSSIDVKVGKNVGGIDVDIAGKGGDKNIIEEVRVNGTALPVVSKAVDVPVPTKVSELDNDAGYLTQHQDLSNYALKSEIPDDYVRDEDGVIDESLIIRSASDPRTPTVTFQRGSSGTDTYLDAKIYADGNALTISRQRNDNGTRVWEKVFEVSANRCRWYGEQLATEEYVDNATEIFWATYGTTTAAEIDAAMAAGKTLFVVDGTVTAAFGDKIGNSYYFSAIAGSTLYRRVLNNGTWQRTAITIENAGSRVSSFQVTPDNNHYPSEKLVKDSLDAIASKGQYRLIASGTISADTTKISVSQDTNGNAFALSQVMVLGKIYGNSSGYTGWIRIDVNCTSGSQRTGTICQQDQAANTYYSFLREFKRVGNRVIPTITLRSINSSSVKDSLCLIQSDYAVESLSTVSGDITSIDILGYATGALGAGTEYEIYGIDA